AATFATPCRASTIALSVCSFSVGMFSDKLSTSGLSPGGFCWANGFVASTESISVQFVSLMNENVVQRLLRASRRTTAMEPITNRSVEDYMYALIPRRDAILEEMEEIAKRDGVPIVGPLVGCVLYQLARLVDAGRIFEMGSAIGYSTIWFARALRPGGKV